MGKSTLFNFMMEKEQFRRFNLFFYLFLLGALVACTHGTKEIEIEKALNFPMLKSTLVQSKVKDATLMKLVIETKPALPERGDYTLEVRYKNNLIPHFIESEGKPEVRVAFFGVPYLEEQAKSKVTVLLKGPKGEQSVVNHEFEVSQNQYAIEKLSVDPSKVTPDKKSLERINAEKKLVQEIYSQVTTKRFWKDSFQKPMTTTMTSPFGNKRLFNGQLKSYHNGLDFRAAVGTSFYSSEAGVVVLARDLYFTGNTVIINHGFGLYTLYAHLSEIKVKETQFVNKGEELGLTGSTGRVSGPHLHWSVMILGERINPMSLVENAQLLNSKVLASE